MDTLITLINRCSQLGINQLLTIYQGVHTYFRWYLSQYPDLPKFDVNHASVLFRYPLYFFFWQSKFRVLRTSKREEIFPGKKSKSGLHSSLISLKRWQRGYIKLAQVCPWARLSTVFTNLLEFGHTYKLIKLSRGEICVANLKAPCEWCESG